MKRIADIYHTPVEGMKTAARAEYKRLLNLMSFEAVFEIAWKEYSIRGKINTPKSELIDRILDAKYGKETTT